MIPIKAIVTGLASATLLGSLLVETYIRVPQKVLSGSTHPLHSSTHPLLHSSTPPLLHSSTPPGALRFDPHASAGVRRGRGLFAVPGLRRARREHSPGGGRGAPERPALSGRPLRALLRLVCVVRQPAAGGLRRAKGGPGAGQAAGAGPRPPNAPNAPTAPRPRPPTPPRALRPPRWTPPRAPRGPRGPGPGAGPGPGPGGQSESARPARGGHQRGRIRGRRLHP
ncbi:hypothetical protein B484DRAFT_222585 [Ochromonadaceae sp. CCMP2298]|nr:hypothetical protein B484DRAFT_222585 [Ochromonadaceae sp. CCMP2298]